MTDRSAPGDVFETIDKGTIRVRYRPGSTGERAAKPMASAAVKARRSLAGLGSEPGIGTPCIYLDDAFADPDDRSRLITEGSVVDEEAGEVWMVVAPEVSPEPPHRCLALLFGAGLASISEVEPLVEGYGLHLADVPSTREHIADANLPRLADAEGELRSAMAVDYVRYLLERESEETLQTLLAAPLGKIETVYRELYGATSSAMEQAWRNEVADGDPDVKPSEFLRMSARYLRPYWRRQLEIFAYMLLSLAFTAAFPFVSRSLFDSAIPSGDFGEVLTLLIVLAGALRSRLWPVSARPTRAHGSAAPSSETSAKRCSNGCKCSLRHGSTGMGRATCSPGCSPTSAPCSQGCRTRSVRGSSKRSRSSSAPSSW